MGLSVGGLIHGGGGGGRGRGSYAGHKEKVSEKPDIMGQNENLYLRK